VPGIPGGGGRGNDPLHHWPTRPQAELQEKLIVRLHATKGVPLTCLCYSSYRPTAYSCTTYDLRKVEKSLYM
jgi:hypothetical protein